MVKGRPRNFDLDIALKKAMFVFWKKGYEGTSLLDLTVAMGIRRPSLYAAFGNKEALFSKVVRLYRSDPASYVNRALEKPTAHEVFESLLVGAIDLLTDPEKPGGCMFVHGALACGSTTDSVKQRLSEQRLEGEQDIRERYQRSVEEGDLEQDADPAALARFTTTLIWGMSVQASGGAGREELLPVARLALASFPHLKK